MAPFTLEDNYDIEATVEYIIRRRFTRVCLQFPDELLKDSQAVVSALKAEYHGKLETREKGEESGESRDQRIDPKDGRGREEGEGSGESRDQRIDPKDGRGREEGEGDGEDKSGKDNDLQEDQRIDAKDGRGREGGEGEDKSGKDNDLQDRRRKRREVQFFVMADTTFGHCCVDEVAAAHVDAECVIHYGYACVSRTSRIPVRYVFGKRPIDVNDAAEKLVQIAVDLNKPLLMLYAPEYGYTTIKHALAKEIAGNHAALTAADPSSSEGLDLVVAKMVGNEMEPEAALERCSSDGVVRNYQEKVPGEEQSIAEEREMARTLSSPGREGELGGLRWSLPEGRSITDYVLAWVGPEGPALTNWMLTYNLCKFVRYDPETKVLIRNMQECSRILKRRYYLVERAKDASIVGIVVGTLGAAGYLTAIKRLREIISAAGKKSYMFVMGKPNPAKLANFPECEVFVLVACPQTALLDSKEYYAPVITPFEAELAFVRGKTWTGEYRLGFSSIGVEETWENGNVDRSRASGSSEANDEVDARDEVDEPRFSMITGSLASKSQRCQHNGFASQMSAVDPSVSRQLAVRMDGALSISGSQSAAVVNMDLTKVDSSKVEINSAAEFLTVRRTYKGLELQAPSAADVSDAQVDDMQPAPVSKAVRGRSGRAASYEGETGRDS